MLLIVPDEDTAGAVCALFVRAVHADLCKLDIPIAEIVPDEVIELADRHAELELLEVFGDGCRDVIEAV